MTTIQPELDFCQAPTLGKFYEYLPEKPYCTDELGYMKIRPKATAAQAAYIQPNPITRAYWLLFDRDRSERFYWPEECRRWKPKKRRIFYLP